MYGKKQSEEAKAKMREASKKRWSKPEEHQKAKNTHWKKKIVQYNLNNEIIGIWSFAGSAAKAVGVSKASISNACHRRVNISGGYKWKFLEEIKKEFFIKKLKKYDKEWKNRE